jgi:excisionase family DNA binding protein
LDSTCLETYAGVEMDASGVDPVLTDLARDIVGIENDSAAEQPNLSEVAMTSPPPASLTKADFAREELPLNVRDAAVFLGVSRQTVYLWVERKQIPHLRVMGRNIRFLKSDLEPFRAQFKQEVVNWQDQ